MISDYMENLTYEPLNLGRTIYNKYIYKNSGNHYIIRKIINGKQINYGTYNTFEEARQVRDQLIANDWDKSIVQDRLDYEKNVKDYYKNIQTNSQSRYYKIVNYQDKYCGQVQTIEEALYYRDLVYDLPKEDIKRPKEFDLITDNPYLVGGLDYPLPERLVLKHKKSARYGAGYIKERGPQSYHIHHGKKGDGDTSYVCACRTYEQAYYVKQEMNKCDWDMSKLNEILDNYPVWYTWLMNFWKFIIPDGDAWLVSLTPRNTGYDNLERIRFHNVEDALWERDLLVKYGFDEELVCECADDTLNPYYDMTIPPYPQRKVRRIKDREPRTELFDTLFTLIQEEPNLSQEEYCERAGMTSANFRTILRNEYDTDWAEFKTLCESGEHPNEVLEQKPLIYNPDLTIHYENTNYVSYHKREKSPYLIYHRNKVTQQSEYFGAYPTRELADKISNDLQKCNWDKSKLKQIQAKYGWKSVVNSKRWVYAHYYTSKKTGEKYVSHYMVRKKNIGYFGTYKDKRVADLVRDCCIMNDWDKSKLDDVKSFAYYVIDQVDTNWRCNL